MHYYFWIYYSIDELGVSMSELGYIGGGQPYTDITQFKIIDITVRH